MPDDLIERILRGTTTDAKTCLLNILVETESVWANVDAVCQAPSVCTKGLSIDHLIALRKAIRDALAADTGQRVERCESP